MSAIPRSRSGPVAEASHADVTRWIGITERGDIPDRRLEVAVAEWIRRERDRAEDAARRIADLEDEVLSLRERLEELVRG